MGHSVVAETGGRAGNRVSFAPDENISPRRAARPNQVQPGSYLWPELRIGRTAIVDVANADLTTFLLDSGRQNRRRGSTRILTEVGCTYVRDTEMMGMIMDKYPRLDGDVRRATRVYRELTKNTRQFILEQQAAIREHELSTVDAERFSDATGLTGPELTSQMWQTGVFAISGQHGFGRNSIGFVLGERDNPELVAERQAIVDFLRDDEKLKVSKIDHEWDPHAVFFDVRPELRLATFAMRYTEATPQLIALGPPAANTDL